MNDDEFKKLNDAHDFLAEKHYAEAKVIYDKLAEEGSAFAHVMLGWMAEFGQGRGAGSRESSQAL